MFEQDGYTWKTIVKAFAEKGLDEDVALQNARLAKILTIHDYDLEKQRPILWTPSDASDGVDNGAGLPVSEDTRSAA